MNYVYIIFLYTVLILMAYCTCAIISCYLWQCQFNPDVFYFKKKIFIVITIFLPFNVIGGNTCSLVFILFFSFYCFVDRWLSAGGTSGANQTASKMKTDASMKCCLTFLHPKNTLIKATQGKININYFLFLWTFLFTFVGQSFKTVLGLHVHYNIWVLKENQLRTTVIDHLKANGKDSVNARLC